LSGCRRRTLARAGEERGTQERRAALPRECTPGQAITVTPAHTRRLRVAAANTGTFAVLPTEVRRAGRRGRGSAGAGVVGPGASWRWHTAAWLLPTHSVCACSLRAQLLEAMLSRCAAEELAALASTSR
jgi:hypothetical protein